MAKWIALTEKNELPNVTKADAGEVLTVNAEGKWEAAPPATQTPIQELPTVSASDSGKFLTVNASGKWEATAIPSAEDANF